MGGNVTQAEIILRDLDNYLMRMELMVLDQQKNLIGDAQTAY